MDGAITFLNMIGKSFVDYSILMLIQSSVLIVALLAIDLLLRKKVRAVFRYCIWMLVLVKLVLPTTLLSPIGLGYWFADVLPNFAKEEPVTVESTSKVITLAMDTTASPLSILPKSITGDTLTLTSVQQATPLTWQGFVFLGWLAVVIAMGLLLVQQMLFVRRLLVKSKNPSDSMFGVFEHCHKQMATGRHMTLKLSSVTASPAVCGLFRPTILIPQTLSDKLKDDDLKSIFLHELAHIKRGDLWISLFQAILQIAYFYNPLLWLANAIIRKVREQAVDEMVLVAMGEQSENYFETLLNISKLTFSRPVLSLRLIGVVESKKALAGRIKHILSKPIPKTAKLGIVNLATIIILGIILLSMVSGENASAIEMEKSNLNKAAPASNEQPTDPNSARLEMPLEFDKDIPVALVVGTNEQPDIVKIDAIRFEMRGDQIVQKLYGFFLRPWPHTDWRFRFELLDGSGSVVGTIKYNMHNRGHSDAETTNEPEPIKSDFCSIGPNSLTGVSKPTRFAIDIEQKPLETENITQTHNISGILMDATETIPEEFWEEFETAQSEKEVQEVLDKKLFSPQIPLPNVIVNLTGKSLTKQAVTDANGKFVFTNLTGLTFGPYGGVVSCETYEISAEIPVQSDPNNMNYTATVKQYIKLDSDKDINLKLRTDLITIKGRVTDSNGQPISGAKVNAKLGINDHAMDEYWENHTPPKWVAISNNDGMYELHGIEPANFYQVFGYLFSGRPYKYIDIKVIANGFVQHKNNIPRVPIMSEDILNQARNFLKHINQISQKTGRPIIHEKEGLDLPSTNGKTITGIDIMLEQVEKE
jgi:beta-lactamase regulating signal transducer with metallopeptidase domain